MNRMIASYEQILKVLTDNTTKIIACSLVRAVDPMALSKHVEPNPDSASMQSRAFLSDDTSNEVIELQLTDYSELVGRSFLQDLEDGQRTRECVQEVADAVEDHEYSTQPERGHVKFKLTDSNKCENIMTYDKVISKVEPEIGGNVMGKFKRIIGYGEALANSHDSYKDSLCNVMVARVWQLLQPFLFWQGDTLDTGNYSPGDDDDKG